MRSTTWPAFLSWAFICQADLSSFRHLSLSGWCLCFPSALLINLFFLQTLLSFSNFSFLQLVLPSYLVLTCRFSSLLSVAYPPSLATYKCLCHFVVIRTSHQHWNVLMFHRVEAGLWRHPGGACTLAPPLNSLVTLGLLNFLCSFSTSVKWGWVYSLSLIKLPWRLNELFHITHI